MRPEVEIVGSDNSGELPAVPEATDQVDQLTEPGPRFDLLDAFGLRQEQLLVALGLGRSIGGHPVAIGDSSELNWRGMLETILPTRYRISKAFVVRPRQGCICPTALPNLSASAPCWRNV
jgi:hypothetical protein